MLMHYREELAVRLQKIYEVFCSRFDLAQNELGTAGTFDLYFSDVNFKYFNLNPNPTKPNPTLFSEILVTNLNSKCLK